MLRSEYDDSVSEAWDIFLQSGHLQGSFWRLVGAAARVKGSALHRKDLGAPQFAVLRWAMQGELVADSQINST